MLEANKTKTGVSPNAIPRYIKLPEVVFVRIYIIIRLNKFPKKLNNAALAGCWLAVNTIVINCKINCAKKKRKYN